MAKHRSSAFEVMRTPENEIEVSVKMPLTVREAEQLIKAIQIVAIEIRLNRSAEKKGKQ
jgi:hypothetical protein